MIHVECIDLVRKARLLDLSAKTRQMALERDGDVEGWHIARMLREATTIAQADEAERRWQAHSQI
jgi:hypothetical protein